MQKNSKKIKSNTISDPRGFNYTISFKRLNNLIVTVNSSVDDYLIDVQLTALTSYHNHLLRFLLSRKEIETLTREIFSISWFRWNVIKIYRQLQGMFRKFFNRLN